MQERDVTISSESTMKWTFNTALGRPSGGSLKCRAKRTFGSGFSALYTLTGFSADPVPEVPPGVDLVHELSSAHSADVCTGRISRSVVQHKENTLEVLTPRGLPSTKVPEGEQTPAPDEEMVDVTVLVLGHTKCSSETEVNDSE